MENQMILIVSSNEAQSRFMVDCLTEAGYKAEVVDQDEKVIPLIGSKPLDLVILDWGFSNSIDLRIIRSIRGVEDNRRLPILVAGTEMGEEDVLAALEAGADNCLTERLHPKVFVARVHSLLRRKIPHSP